MTQTITLYCQQVEEFEKEIEVIYSLNGTTGDHEATLLANHLNIKDTNPDGSLIVIRYPKSMMTYDNTPLEDNWYGFPLSFFDNLSENNLYLGNNLMRFQLKHN